MLLWYQDSIHQEVIVMPRSLEIVSEEEFDRRICQFVVARRHLPPEEQHRLFQETIVPLITKHNDETPIEINESDIVVRFESCTQLTPEEVKEILRYPLTRQNIIG